MGRPRYGVRDEVKDSIDLFYRALSNKSLKGMEQAWVHAPYAVVAGPHGEIQQGWEEVSAFFAHRFDQLADVKIVAKLSNMVCHVVGDVAWLSGKERRILTQGEEQEMEELRVTCVLQRLGTNWQLVSYHASLPVPDQTPALLPS